MRTRLLPMVALTLLGCSRPDVIFITVDTLRVDHVGAFADDSPALTPHMDDLARDGVVYSQAYSPISVTGPAFCTLHTGQLPGTHGVTMNLFRGGNALEPSTETLAERLQGAGYRTGAFVSGFTLRARLGLLQGFDRYDQPKNKRREGRMTTDRMLQWLDEETGPFSSLFLWWHTYDPHGPLSPWADAPAPGTWTHDADDFAHIPKYQQLNGVSDPGFYAQRYALAVEHTDEQVGRIVSWLKAEGRYDDALIVLTADHGESFTERELWFDHGTTPHEEQLHVPLIVKYPEGEGARTRVDALVGLHDIVPTVYAVLGEDLPDDLDGRPLHDPATAGHPVLTGESSHCKKESVLRCDPEGPLGKMLAARSDDWTFVRRPTASGDEDALYDRKTDLAERVPLDPSPTPAALRSAVDALTQDRRTRDYSGYDVSTGSAAEQEEQAALEALGYQER